MSTKDDSVIIDVTPDSDDEPERTSEAKDASQPAAQAQQKKPGRARWVFLALLIVLAGGIAGGVYYQPQISAFLGLPKPTSEAALAAPDPALLTRLEALEGRVTDQASTPSRTETDTALLARIDELENRLATLESLPPPESGSGADLGPLMQQQRQTAQQIQQLAGAIRQLEQRVQTAESAPSVVGGATDSEIRSLADQLSSLFDQQLVQQQRIADLERAGTQDVFQPVSILALSRLRQSVESSLPYEAALDGVKRLFEARGRISVTGQQALDQLEASSATGIASMATLTAEFDSVVPKIMAARALPEEADWMDRTWASIQNAVTIRQTGEIEGDGVDAIVARAEQDMDQNNLTAAVEELAALTGRPGNVAADWLSTAQSRLNALQAIDTLEAELAEGADG
ncbi:MAG: COG4223 family protein [Alphaproteobacteria bacterium]